MLTDTKLRNLKAQDRMYKVANRDGLYVAVTKAGSISFRYNYALNGRQETVTFGQYGVGGITLAEARERLNGAKKMIAGGKSPAREKTRAKNRNKDAKTFDDWAKAWLRGYEMADSTQDMRRACYDRELKGPFGNKLLTEITHDDLRSLTDKIVDRGRQLRQCIPVRWCRKSIGGPSSVDRRSRTRRSWCARRTSPAASRTCSRRIDRDQ
jgi:hypothetical protein